MQRKENRIPKSTMAGWLAVLIMIFQLIIQQINYVRAWKNALSIKLNLPHITITLLITLTVAVILSLYFNLHYIAVSRHKLVKKYKNPPSKKSRSKIEKPMILPPKVELLKILNLIDEKKSITKETLIIGLKYSNKIVKKYLKQLLKAEYIKIKSVYKNTINRLLPFFNKSNTIYLMDCNGQQTLNDIALINLRPPYVGNH